MAAASKGTILNICLNGAYTDGFTYQDNLLPKYQRRLGYEVTVVAPDTRFGEGGGLERVPECKYVNEDGVRVIRLSADGGKELAARFRTYGRLGGIIGDVAPGIIFLHGCQFLGSAAVANYVREHPNTCLYVDNHADYSNSASSWLSKHVLHRVIWRHYAQMLEPYTTTFWGVLPARVDFLVENYGLPPEKCKLLVMGGDDDEIDRVLQGDVRAEVRMRLGVPQDASLVVFGGKIDAAKHGVLNMLRAVAALRAQGHPELHLLVFGPVAEDMTAEFEALVAPEGIHYIPWADRHEAYDYFAAADLVAFPCRHSVYWEQAAALGRPLLVRRWPGTDHVDGGGNVAYVEGDGVEEIQGRLVDVLFEEGCLARMSEVARGCAAGFRYSEIARRSVGLDAGEEVVAS